MAMAGNIYSDQESLLGGFTIAMVILTFLCTGLRFWSRKMSHARLWWDDWMMLLLLACATALNAVTLLMTYHDGGGKHAAVLNPQQPKDFIYHAFIDEILTHLSVAIVKFAILFLYVRIFSARPFKMILWATGILIMLWAVANILVLIFRCTPVEKAWKLDIPGHCVNTQKFLYGQSVPDVVFDVILLFLPIAFISRVQMSMPQKAALSAVFLLGGFTIVCSTMRLVAFIRLDVDDIPYGYTGSLLWATLETDIGLLVACLMTCGALFKHVLLKLHITKSSGGGSGNHPGVHTIGSKPMRRFDASANDGFENILPANRTRGTAAANESLENLTRSSPDSGNRISWEMDKIYVRRDVQVTWKPDEEMGASDGRVT